jgi:putative peptide zinc metalloprotease protein
VTAGHNRAGSGMTVATPHRAMTSCNARATPRYHGQRLDCLDRDAAYLMSSPGGKLVRLSETAHALLSLHRSGWPAERIATKLAADLDARIDVGAVNEALAVIEERLAQIDETRAKDGFLLSLRLIPPGVVRLLARPLVPLFRPAIAVVFGLLCAAIVGASLFSLGTPALTPDTVWTGYALSLASLLLHELGHAAACMRFGARPSHIGFTIYFVYPAFFSDVTDAWRLSRRQRLLVDAGGMYVQLVVGVVFLAIYSITHTPAVLAAVWMIGGTCVVSLNPLFKFDGYWIVSDLLGVTNLSQQRRRTLRHCWERLRGRPSELPWPRHITRAVCVYAAVSMGFFAWFVARLFPTLVQEAGAYPDTVTALVRALQRGEYAWAVWEPFIIQSLILFIFVLLARRLAASLWSLLQRATSQWASKWQRSSTI